MNREIQQFVKRHSLLRPGDRAGVAVSGGADSVALLCALLDLKAELGLVLSVVHFNHKLRGEESDQDEQFVRGLAAKNELEIHVSEADTRRFAREKEFSLEAAARELRYRFFGQLIAEGLLDKVATAHTLDDQAETVLLRVFRGTGTSGLSGIHPRLVVGPKNEDWKGIIRPLLGTRRCEIEAYLSQKQWSWRTDSTNAETFFTRNRVRHELLPQIEKSFNPEIKGALANLAEIARVEDEFWSTETAEAFVNLYRDQRLEIRGLLKLHKALQRRVIRLAAIQFGATLDFHHGEQILDHLHQKLCKLELPHGFRAIISTGWLWFEANEPQAKPCGYSYRLTIPSEIAVAELGVRVRTTLVSHSADSPDYNDEPALAWENLPQELVFRNWRPGDRFWPSRTRAPKKVKELLQERHVPAREKALWPVALAGEEIVWMRGFPVAANYVAMQGKAVRIEELPLLP